MQLLVETFRNQGESSRADIRVRPVAGQAYPPSMRVECSRARRDQSPPGRFYILDVQMKSTPGKANHLYCYYGAPWREMNREDAATFIAASSRNAFSSE